MMYATFKNVQSVTNIDTNVLLNKPPIPIPISVGKAHVTTSICAGCTGSFRSN